MAFSLSLLFFIISSLVLIVIAFLELMVFFMPVKVRYMVASRWAIINIWLLKVIVGLDYKIIGLENIPKQPCVILSNHQSTWETFIFQLILGQQTWVLKKQLLYIPFFGWGIALIKPIIIDRSDKLSAIKKVIKQGKDRLSKGIWVIIFPEGTRKTSIGNYQNGGAMIAKSANAMILPAYHNSGNFWRKGQFIKKKGTINLVIGKPIATYDKNAKELTKEVENWAKEKEREFKETFA